MFPLPDIIGVFGVFLCVGAYALKELNHGFGDRLAYSLMNMIGAFLVVLSLLFDWNLAAMVQEVIWITIGCYGLYNSYKRS